MNLVFYLIICYNKFERKEDYKKEAKKPGGSKPPCRVPSHLFCRVFPKRNDNFRQEDCRFFCSLHFSFFTLLSSLKLSFPDIR